MVVVDHEELRSYITATCLYLGTPSTTADAVAHSLVEADLRGHESHGVMRMPIYTEKVESGVIDPSAEPNIERITDQAALIDGRHAFGQYVGRVAVDELLSVSKNGIGVVGIRNATHLGRIGEWAEAIANEGLLFIALVKGTSDRVAPPGSVERRLATNPIAFGIPTFSAVGFPIVLDIATSQVAHGKVRAKAKNNASLPEGWAMDDNGTPLTNATAYVEDSIGAMLPLGGMVAGHKGFGLSVIVELFSSLTGDADVRGQDTPTTTGNAATFVALDPTMFSPKAAIETRITAFIERIRTTDYSAAVPVGAAAAEPGQVPGEPEYRHASRQLETGIDVSPGVAASLLELAERHGLMDELPKQLHG